MNIIEKLDSLKYQVDNLPDYPIDQDTHRAIKLIAKILEDLTEEVEILKQKQFTSKDNE
jgi:hypothetical protein